MCQPAESNVHKVWPCVVPLTRPRQSSQSRRGPAAGRGPRKPTPPKWSKTTVTTRMSVSRTVPRASGRTWRGSELVPTADRECWPRSVPNTCSTHKTRRRIIRTARLCRAADRPALCCCASLRAPVSRPLPKGWSSR
eukprot:5515175-Prymnesium_polylepis.1